MISKFKGTGVALVTPFDAALQIDWSGLERLLERVATSGVDYLVVHGTTGEAATTTPEEKKAILRFVQAHNPRKLPIVCGVGGNSTQEVLRTLEDGAWQGVDAVLTVCPYYNRPSQEGLCQHYAAVADACPAPLMLYNVPARTGVNLAAATTLQLSAHANIVGIKEASGSLLQCMEIAAEKQQDFLLISGDDMLTLPMMAVGAVGLISTLGNAFPHKMSEMVTLGLRGDFVKAQQHAFDLLGLFRLVFDRGGNPVGTKQLLALLGVCEPYVRLPLVRASAALADELRGAEEWMAWK